LKRDEHEGQVEEHASSHVEDVCIEEDQTTTYDTPLEITNEANDTSVLDGCTYDEFFKSSKYEDPTSFHVYDVDDERVRAPNYDVDSVPYPIYDMYDDVGMRG
jgi:hypothetical protein